MRVVKLQLEEDILNQTRECMWDFSCLDNDKSCLCEVDELINNKLLFIKTTKMNACNYMISFGYSYYCNCPTRNELYKRYKV
jgi:hypothetical protein